MLQRLNTRKWILEVGIIFMRSLLYLRIAFVAICRRALEIVRRTLRGKTAYILLDR